MSNEFAEYEEVERFFEWLRHFEAEVPTLDGGARWYMGRFMQAHVHYSWFKASVAGIPSICLADVVLAASPESTAFLGRSARRFALGCHPLQAQVLYVEQPREERLRSWFADNGFRVCAAPGEERQSWYVQSARRLPCVVDIHEQVKLRRVA